ncbi:hypothetical protein [Methylobacterium oryzisoli]|uniref:hypothetical protein n=1 Tax=Methylobacterium oryzisoli TaxID=3385502 RepID=UPI003891B418
MGPAAGIPAARARRLPAPRRVPLDRSIALAGLIGLAGALASTGLLAAWLIRAPAADGTLTRQGPAGRPVALPAAWFVRPSVSASPDRLDLMIPWGALTGGEGGDKLHVTVTRSPETEAPLSPARRYARFLTVEVQPLPDEGLVRRRFKAGSPFEGEDLYLAQTDGSRFAARCTAAGQADHETACLSEVRIGDLSLRLRFAAERLPAWRGLLRGLEQLFAPAPPEG